MPISTPLFTNVPVVGRVTFVAAVDVKVIEFAPEVARVDPSVSVRVAEVVGAVKATLFRLVAVATPISGVVNVGLAENTKLVELVPVVPVAELK